MESSEATFQRLKQDTGIDFNALREKYKNMPRECEENNGQDNSQESEVNRNRDALKQLDKYKVCKTCHGLGTVTEVYNHFNIETNCPDCDGECIMHQEIPTLNAP
mmetsp:Transcript_12202/g.18432  ORF Transcript_12202/g.18432 Transcript_12202/m.18432 type:complete len:105 (+) Transcript_12202:57-371(+)